MILSPVLKQRFFDANGNPLAGGKLYSYVAGTTTPQATYTDSTGSTPNANPVVLDANGEANVWTDSALSYKFILTDSNDVQMWSVDAVANPNAGEIPGWAPNVTYSQGSIVRDASGEGMLYVSLTNSNLNNALTSVVNWRMFDGKVRTISASGNATVLDNLIIVDTTAGHVTVTLPPCGTTPIGKKITIKHIPTDSNVIYLKGSGSELVDGFNQWNHYLDTGNAATVQNNGTSWFVVSAYIWRDIVP